MKNEDKEMINSRTLRNLYWTCSFVSFIVLIIFFLLAFSDFLPQEEGERIQVDSLSMENYLKNVMWFVGILLSTYTILNRIGRYEKYQHLPRRGGERWVYIFWIYSSLLLLFSCLNINIYWTNLYFEYSTMVLMIFFGNKVIKHLKLKEIAELLKILKFIGGK